MNGNGTEEIFSLQALYDFMNKMLRSTELTKRTLQMECEEAKFALKPWPIETRVVKQIDRNTCTCEEVRVIRYFNTFVFLSGAIIICDKDLSKILTLCLFNQGINSEERAEEIAAEIGRTLLHSQQLREKLAANLHKERQTSRRPDVREIYTSAFKKPLKETNGNVERPRRSLSQQRPSEPRTSRVRSASTARGSSENVSGRKSVTSKTQIKTSKDNILAQITGYQRPKNQTNFILANKLSVKSTKSSDTCKRVQSKSQMDLRKIGSGR